jgi:hypothetical protein
MIARIRVSGLSQIACIQKQENYDSSIIFYQHPRTGLCLCP